MVNPTANSIFKTAGVVWLVLHAHAARKDPSGAGVLFDMKSSLGYWLRLGWWATGLKVERIVGGMAQPEPRPIRPEFLRELASLPSTHALQPWLAEIPFVAFSHAAGFDFGQLELLRLLQLAPRTADLIPSNPLLHWLLAWTLAERGTPLDDALEIASWTRRDLAEWCGGINSKACLRMIEKFDPPQSHADLERLRRAIADPDAVALSVHTETPFTGTYLLRRQPELRQLRAFQAELNDASRTSGPESVIGWLRDTRKIAELLECDVEPSIRGCPNAAALKGLHDRLLIELYATAPPKLRELRSLVVSFGRPPVPGTPDIEPIRTTAELAAEGELMDHCCASHVWSVQRGETYFYRVFRPQRATLEVAISKKHVWLYELKLRRNDEPSEETYEFVRQWLQMNQQQTGRSK
ncbi:MAG: hypothetical protein WDO74_33715 [Pseudomonadota bacterium]